MAEGGALPYESDELCGLLFSMSFAERAIVAGVGLRVFVFTSASSRSRVSFLPWEWGLRFRLRGLGIRVKGLRFIEFKVQGTESRVWGLERVSG